MDETLYVERWLTFTLADGRWDISFGRTVPSR